MHACGANGVCGALNFNLHDTVCFGMILRGEVKIMWYPIKHSSKKTILLHHNISDIALFFVEPQITPERLPHPQCSVNL